MPVSRTGVRSEALFVKKSMTAHPLKENTELYELRLFY
jgi:hypothetical protein